MLDASTVAARLRTLADRVHRLQGISHRRPHAFLEGKDEIARALDDLATEILKPDRANPRAGALSLPRRP